MYSPNFLSVVYDNKVIRNCPVNYKLMPTSSVTAKTENLMPNSNTNAKLPNKKKFTAKFFFKFEI